MRNAIAWILIAGGGWAVGLSPLHAAPLYPQPFFEVGDEALGVAAADLNGDGLPDLLVGARRYLDGCAEVFLSGAPSLLRSLGCSPIGGDPVAFASADFDGDGHADIAIGWRDFLFPLEGGGIVVELGHGDGTFLEVGRIQAGDVSDLVTGDFDGDGFADLAVVGADAGTNAPFASVLPGMGGGAFGAPLWEKRSGQPVRVAAADFDGNGVSDLALTDLVEQNVQIYLGSLSGTLDLRAAYDAGLSPAQVAAADLDGDGRTDLAVVNRQDSEIRTFGGLGNGQFQSRPGLVLGMPPGELAAGDFDGDGRADLAVAEHGTLQVEHRIVLLAEDGHGGLRMAGTADARAGRMVAADLDGDGLADLAAASGKGVAVLRSLDDFAFPGNITVTEELLRGAYAHDFDLDGRDDLAVFYPYDGDIYIYPGRSDGTFGEYVEVDAGNPSELLRAGDFNGDEVPDLVALGSGRAVFFLGLGSGQWAPPRTVFLTFTSLQDVTVIDMNLDGRDDVVIVARQSLFRPEGYITIILPASDGTFDVSLPWDAGDNPQGVAAADFDADGDLDLAITNMDQGGPSSTGSLNLHMNPGNLVFGTAVATPMNGTVGGVAAADLNGDTLPDLVVAKTPAGSSMGALEVFLGAGGGAFSPGVRHDATPAPIPVLVRDVDGDGALDLVTLGSGGGDVALLRGDGLGGFGNRENYATYLSFQSITAGDFNGDGLADLALANQNTTYSDGRVIVVPARPPFPCLPAPVGESGQCVQDAADFRISYQSQLGHGAGIATWRTTHEYDVIGYNLLAFDVSGNPIRLNSLTIPCVECVSGLGAAYTFPLAKYRSGRNVFLEMLRHSGPPRIFGPAKRE